MTNGNASELGTNLFIQDSSGGNWVEAAASQQPLKPGQLIELQGITTQTDFAPDIVKASWSVLGPARMPAAVRAEFGTLASAKLDSRLAEIEGIIRSAEIVKGDLKLQIAMDGGTAMGYVPNLSQGVPPHLVDAKVRIRAVSGAIFNEHNQVRGVNLFKAGLGDISVLKPGFADPFLVPKQSIDSLLRFTAQGSAGHRVRISGVVTLQRRGRYFFLTDNVGGVLVQSADQNLLRPGDRVEAVGFPAIGQYVPKLEQAVVRVVEHGPPPPARPVTATQLRQMTGDGELVQVEADLLDRALTSAQQILFAKADNSLVIAQLEGAELTGNFADVRPGSRVLLTGVRSLQDDGDSASNALRLLLRSPEDIVVLSKPSWWTFRHAIWAFGVMSGVILVAFAWMAIMRRQYASKRPLFAGG